MGTYINKGNEGFRSAVNGEYVDKTGLIEVISKTLNTERRYTCLTRCRRFGKTMAVDMLRAYYDKSCDSRQLFEGLSVAKCESFEEHLNKYPVITLDVTDFLTRYGHDSGIVDNIQRDLLADIVDAYPDIPRKENDDLMEFLIRIHQHTHEKFIMLIDEWDAICREFEKDSKVMDAYINLLRRLFKGSNSKDVFAGVYMTGILPIKKYNTQSALNNFREYSVVKPEPLAPYFGFTPEEVSNVAKGEVSIEELKAWYDGYQIGKLPSVYNPYSVMEAIARNGCDSFWTTTSAYDQVATYIEMNFEGLRDDIINMLAGGRCSVDTTGFSNDMHDVRTKDDVLTVLIHLGYLSYDREEEECYIPNKEVGMEMVNAVKSRNWKVAEALDESKKLLRATLACDEDAVARGIDLAHDENTSILSYNDENSLACVLNIAYYHAKNDYIIHRELASGKGFADLVLIPRRNANAPALVIELKYDKSADAAINQIKRKNYPAKVAEYTGDILLVGINYDKETKKHSCTIERFSK